MVKDKIMRMYLLRCRSCPLPVLYWVFIQALGKRWIQGATAVCPPPTAPSDAPQQGVTSIPAPPRHRYCCGFIAGWDHTSSLMSGGAEPKSHDMKRYDFTAL